MTASLRFRPLAVAMVAGSLSMGVLTACSDAAGATPESGPVGTTAGPEPGGAPGVVPLGAPTPRNAPPLWPGGGAGPAAPGGALLVVPQQGVGAGGGSTAGVEDLGLFGAGATALAGAGASGLVARRRRGQA